MDLGLRGLANLGNTCYLNACIISLGYCDNFRKFILSKDYISANTSVTTVSTSKNNLVEELEEIYRELWINNNSIIPRKFIKALKDNITSIEINEENDIGEFLVIYLDKLNQSISYVLEPEIKTYSKDSYGILSEKLDIEWYKTVSKEYSRLCPLFYGQNIVQISCGKCNKIHHNYETYSILMLPLNQSSNSLIDCLDAYFHHENLNTNDNPWKCDRCNTSTESKKTVLLWKNPEILIISVKRFDNFLRKNNKKIEIPEFLDISKYTLDKKSSKYKLRSVASHVGSLNGGHYVSIVKNNEKWYLIDDLDVKFLEHPDLGSGYIYYFEQIIGN